MRISAMWIKLRVFRNETIGVSIEAMRLYKGMAVAEPFAHPQRDVIGRRKPRLGSILPNSIMRYYRSLSPVIASRRKLEPRGGGGTPIHSSNCSRVTSNLGLPLSSRSWMVKR